MRFNLRNFCAMFFLHLKQGKSEVNEPNFSQLPWKVLSQERPRTKFHGIPLDLPCLKCKKNIAQKMRRLNLISSLSSIF